MENVAIAGMSEETTKKLNFFLRRLTSMKERAEAELAGFSKKLEESPNKLDVFYWSEKTFEQAAKYDVARYYLNVLNSFIANTGPESSSLEANVKLINFIENFEEANAKAIAREVSCSSFSTMQTANLASHYKAKAYAELGDLI